MSNATRVNEIGKRLHGNPTPDELRQFGDELQAMLSQQRKAESVHKFLLQEGGEKAVAEVLQRIEADRLQAAADMEAQLVVDLAMPKSPMPFTSNVIAISPSVAMSRAGWNYGEVGS